MNCYVEQCHTMGSNPNVMGSGMSAIGNMMDPQAMQQQRANVVKLTVSAKQQQAAPCWC
jgi:hypothetical protein